MVTRRQILEFSQRLAERFKPDKIILFGSRAYGRPTRDSDVDLLLVMRYRGNAFEFTTRMAGLVRPNFALDLIVRSPQEIARQYREYDPLARDALDRGVVLYERNCTRVDGESRGRLSGSSFPHARAKAPQLRRRRISCATVH